MKYIYLNGDCLAHIIKEQKFGNVMRKPEQMQSDACYSIFHITIYKDSVKNFTQIVY